MLREPRSCSLKRGNMNDSLSRRGLLAAVGPTILIRARAQQGGRRPNILWISCEDAGSHLGCYGDRRAITPNLDRLAREGVRYRNAFTVAGVCAPSRSGIITGMYPSTLGSMHMRCKASLPAQVRCFPEFLRRAGYYCTNNTKTDYNFDHPAETWDESSPRAHWRNRRPGQPFFAVFNITVSHESRIPQRGEAFARTTARLGPSDRQNPELLNIPPYHPDTPEARRDWANYYELVTAMDYEAGDRLRELNEDGLRNETIVFFWSDHGTGLPRAKRWLYDSGTRVPLIVRVPEKYRAYGQGRPGTVSHELISMIDLAPTVLSAAGIPLPEQFQGRAFLGESLGSPRQYVYGHRDRMDERYDIIRSVRDSRYRYIRNYEPWKPYYQFMSTAEQGPTMQELRRLHAAGALRQAAAQFMADSKPPEELYDLRRDPHEIRNLAGDRSYREVLERFREAHESWMDQTGDLGLLPESELEIRERELGSRYAILRQPGTEGLNQRLRQLARLASGGEEGAAALREALKHEKDAAARYWAATGLGNLREKAGPAAEDLRAALADSSWAVRIASARALLRLGRAGLAEPVLLDALKHNLQGVRLQAITVLDEEQYKPSSVLAAIEPLTHVQDRNYVSRVAKHLYDGGAL
jgi:arylsulfatase A-like enzyme